MSVLQNKTALVTGSSSGIGLGVARYLATTGCRIMMHGIEPESEVTAAMHELELAGALDVQYRSVDISQPGKAQALADDTRQALGDIDILINNAGIQHVAPVTGFDDAAWDRVIEINLSAPFRLIRQVLPSMRERGWGRIINIASVHGQVASPNKAAYVAAKHGLIGLTKTVALETATDPITCNAICPGWVRTPLVEAQLEVRAEHSGLTVEEEAVELVREKQPSLGFVSPDDIGGAVGFLCSDSANQMTGAALTIDGGWTAQ